jgi:hypothetical protein
MTGFEKVGVGNYEFTGLAKIGFEFLPQAVKHTTADRYSVALGLWRGYFYFQFLHFSPQSFSLYKLPAASAGAQMGSLAKPSEKCNRSTSLV